MNYWDVIEGNWRQAKDNIRTRWSRLTDDQIEEIAGKRDELVETIQECYGVALDEAERQVSEWESRSQQLFAPAARRHRKRAESRRAQHARRDDGTPDSTR